MYKFGAIVLVRFPFTDLTNAKLRPALVVSNKLSVHSDVVVCFMTSQKNEDIHSVFIKANSENGLKTDSMIRFDKIATLNKKVILGELGHLGAGNLKKYKEAFYSVFGF